MKLKFWLIFLLALLSGCTRDLSEIQDGSYTEQEIDLVVQQLNGEVCYWYESGEKVGLFDRWLTNVSFEQTCRKSAARFLARLGSHAKPAVPALIEVLENQTPKVKDSVGEAGNFSIRAEAARALGKIGDPRAIDKLVTFFEISRKDASYLDAGRRKAAVEALAEIGILRSDVINVFIQGLEDQDQEVKATSAGAVGQFKIEQAVLPLVKLLGEQALERHTVESERYKRLEAIEALVEIGVRRPDVLDVFLKGLEDHDNRVKAAYAEALGHFKVEEAIVPLTKLVRNRDQVADESEAWSESYRREAAIEALVEIGILRPEVVDVLLQGLQDNEIRAASAQAVGQLGVEQAIVPLIKLLKDPSNAVRRQAAKSLGMFGTKSRAAIPLLIQAIENPPSDGYEDSARASVALALGDVGAYEQKELLTQLSQDKNSEVRWAAKKSLEKLNHKKPDPFTNDER